MSKQPDPLRNLAAVLTRMEHRLLRIETRVSKLMMHLGCDPLTGKPTQPMKEKDHEASPR